MAKTTLQYRDTTVASGSNLYAALEKGDTQEAELLYWESEVEYRRWNAPTTLQEAKDKYNKLVEAKKLRAKVPP
jgi:hypothetical protein